MKSPDQIFKDIILTVAREKLKAKGCDIVSIIEEIKINPKGDGIKILK